MFSILICSVNATYLERLKKNIQETIGNDYELLIWDNLANPKPITEVYNLLAAGAKSEFFCFIHEDIIFQTLNWSVLLKNAFDQHPEIGLIGIAGSEYKSKTPSGWSTGLPRMDYCNIFHKDKNGVVQHLYNNPGKKELQPVVNVDGVFMAIRKKVWADIRFNDQLRGFHLYDIDFSFHIVKKWEAAILFHLDILHFTQGGDFGNEWLINTLKWHAYYSKSLPQSTGNFVIPSGLEKKIARNWLYRLRTEKISPANKWKWIKASGAIKNPLAWPYIGLFLFGKNFRRNN